MNNVPKCHCKTKLKKKPKFKGRDNVFKCPKCDCVYGLTLARMSNECAKKISKAPIITLAEIRRIRAKKRKKKK